MNGYVINVVLFQIGWFACVLSAAAGHPWLGALMALLIIAWHVRRAPLPRAETKLIVLAVAIGAIWESLLVWQGWLVYPTGMLLPNVAPYWIVVMWALFAITLNASLRWLKGRWLMGVLFGAAGGPLAFLAGREFGAVEFADTQVALTALMIGWAVLTPLLLGLSRRYDGYSIERATP